MDNEIRNGPVVLLVGGAIAIGGFIYAVAFIFDFVDCLFYTIMSDDVFHMSPSSMVKSCFRKAL